jgi:hypothetical protein
MATKISHGQVVQTEVALKAYIDLIPAKHWGFKQDVLRKLTEREPLDAGARGHLKLGCYKSKATKIRG